MAYPSVAFNPVDAVVGVPPINSTIAVSNPLTYPLSASGTPPVPCGIQALNQLGEIIKAYDPNFGVGEFKFMLGVASTAAGDAVIYNEAANTTTRGVAGSRGPVGIAMSANVANQAGWYQISGSGPVNTGANAVAAGAPMYWTATAGALDDAVVAGDKIDAMVAKAANSGGFTTVELARPSANGNG